MGMGMEDSQLEELTKRLGFNGRGLQYQDFVHNFERIRGKSIGQVCGT